MGPRTRTVALTPTSRVSFRSRPSSPCSTVADGSQTLGMNEGAGCRLKQPPLLSPPFSAGLSFVLVRCPHTAYRTADPIGPGVWVFGAWDDSGHS